MSLSPTNSCLLGMSLGMHLCTDPERPLQYVVILSITMLSRGSGTFRCFVEMDLRPRFLNASNDRPILLWAFLSSSEQSASDAFYYQTYESYIFPLIRTPERSHRHDLWQLFNVRVVSKHTLHARSLHSDRCIWCFSSHTPAPCWLCNVLVDPTISMRVPCLLTCYRP